MSKYEELWFRRSEIQKEMETVRGMGKTGKHGHLSFSSNPKLAWQLQKLERDLKAVENEMRESIIIIGRQNGKTDLGADQVARNCEIYSGKKIFRLPK